MEIPPAAIEVLARRKHERVLDLVGRRSGVPSWSVLSHEKKWEYREAARADLEEPAEIIRQAVEEALEDRQLVA